MRISDCHITVGIVGGNKPEVLYCGPNASEAATAFAQAGAEFSEVGVIAFPQPVFPRYPAEEAPKPVTIAQKKSK